MAETDAWSFSGYGTLGYHHLSTGDVRYSRDLSQRDGSQPQSGWLSESRIGLQAAYRFNPQTEAVVQAVIHDQYRMTAANLVEWAYVSHRPAPAWQVRVGRVGADFYLLSDLRSLDYSQTDARPVFAFYGFIPINSVDGIDVTWSRPTQDGAWRLKAQTGYVRTDLPGNHFVARGYGSINATYETGAWRFRVGHARMTVENAGDELAGLIGGLNQIAAIGVPGVSAESAGLAHAISFGGARAHYDSLGAAYDDGSWVGQGEISSARLNRRASAMGDAAYVTLGRRIGAFTPYAEASTFRPTGDAAAPVIDWMPILGPQASMLQAGALLAINATRVDQSGHAVGLRWDFHRQAALKLQWDRIDIGRLGYGNFSVPFGHPQRGQSVSLWSAGINWVF